MTARNDVPENVGLVALGDTKATIANPDLDLRGRDVIARDGDKVGKVDDILVDEKEGRARLLRVGSGGFLGIGEDHYLVPIDAITDYDDDAVHINRDRSGFDDVPVYDPDLARDDDYYSDVYGWWGAAPFWGPGYVYPHR